jgi:hypothetical protein
VLRVPVEVGHLERAVGLGVLSPAVDPGCLVEGGALGDLQDQYLSLRRDLDTLRGWGDVDLPERPVADQMIS